MDTAACLAARQSAVPIVMQQTVLWRPLTGASMGIEQKGMHHWCIKSEIFPNHFYVLSSNCMSPYAHTGETARGTGKGSPERTAFCL